MKTSQTASKSKLFVLRGIKIIRSFLKYVVFCEKIFEATIPLPLSSVLSHKRQFIYSVNSGH